MKWAIFAQILLHTLRAITFGQINFHLNTSIIQPFGVRLAFHFALSSHLKPIIYYAYWILFMSSLKNNKFSFDFLILAHIHLNIII